MGVWKKHWCVENAMAKRTVRARTYCTSAFRPIVCTRHFTRRSLSQPASVGKLISAMLVMHGALFPTNSSEQVGHPQHFLQELR